MEEERIITSDELDEDLDNIRPSTLAEYIGQSDVKENMKVFIEAAKLREETLDQLLLLMS